ncbi:MAG: cyclic nucleotide-binding domain-containing protein [Treponema sp.]|jgi:anti-sigma regulatory factor (Ser/Thr protein kinase)|nr:cyclic nucleotide-binding domain-containing protein [Treponema sp.]
MSVLGVINSDQEIQALIASVIEETPDLDYTLKFLAEEAEILDFLSYDLPEFVLINFSDPAIPLDRIVSHSINDKWLFNFGVIGLYSQEQTNEEDLLAQYRAVNLLSLINRYCIRSHLGKNIKIIEENSNLVFQREFTQQFPEGASGSFIIENDLLAVPLYTGISAVIMTQRGLINPNSKMRLQLALSELIINAIEHGNCGISYEEKTAIMEQGLNMMDLIAGKCQDPAIRARRVYFQWEIAGGRSIFTIRDEGNGFNVREHLKKVAQKDAMSLHGRGIQIASKLSQELIYNEKGNQVKLIINHDPLVEHEIPMGFSQETVVLVKKGDIVLQEGEPGDCLYYISSGTYSVYHNQKQIGSLSSQDIFMGEMAFLLNRKRSASVYAESEGKLVLLTRKTFVKVIREYPHYGIFLSKLLAKRLIRSNDLIIEKTKGL